MSKKFGFNDKRPKVEVISKCKDEACMEMQEIGYTYAQNFSKWMTFFITHHKGRENLDPMKKMLLILDGHKSHVSIEVLLKAKTYRVDKVSLSSHTSHELQLLYISCFKPFKQSFRAYWLQIQDKRFGLMDDSSSSKTIQIGFRIASIQPLNREAMVGKIEQMRYFNNHRCQAQLPKMMWYQIKIFKTLMTLG